MTREIANELKNITHPGLVAQCWKHGDPELAVKEIREQIRDNENLCIEILGDKLVKAVKKKYRFDVKIGDRFNRLTVESPTRHPKTGRKAWLCRCDCGNTKIATLNHLTSGFITSCGCGRGRHKLSGTRFWFVWRMMVYRCKPENAKQYPRYSGRGIRVEERWQLFENFYADMFPSYRPGLTIERIDNNKGYSRDNCKWATVEEQNLNKRGLVFIEIGGIKRTISGWAKYAGLTRPCVDHRYKVLGLTDERLIAPVGSYRKKQTLLTLVENLDC